MEKYKEREIFKEKADKWISKIIDIDNIGKYHILVEDYKVIFWKSYTKFNIGDAYNIVKNSREVSRCWWTTQESKNVFNIQYTNDEIERLYDIRQLRRREWFNKSYENLKSTGYSVNEEIIDFATYYIYSIDRSNIDFDSLEKMTGIDFSFEKMFNKPRSKVYSIVDVDGNNKISLKKELEKYYNNIKGNYEIGEIKSVLWLLEKYDDKLTNLGKLDRNLLLRLIDDDKLYEKVDSINVKSNIVDNNILD